MRFQFTGALAVAAVLTLGGCQASPSNRTVIPVDQDAEPDASNSVSNVSVQPKPTATDAFIPSRALKTGVLQNPALSEVSGLAASQRYPNTLWAINDSGNSAKLYAFDQNGQALESFVVAARNRDWEDLAAASINGEPYLLIGDIGDNLGINEDHSIYVLAEPLLDEPAVDALQPIHTVRYRYPDKSHNSEALAYANGFIYVLTKASLNKGKRQASQVFRIPLDFNNQNTVLVAEEIASLAIPARSIESSLIASIGGVDISQPTAFDIDTQNRYAYMLTYRSVYRYQREPNQSWAMALSKPRTRVHSHSLSQAEALTVDASGVVWFTSEKKPAPLWALPPADY